MGPSRPSSQIWGLCSWPHPPPPWIGVLPEGPGGQVPSPDSVPAASWGSGTCPWPSAPAPGPGHLCQGEVGCFRSECETCSPETPYPLAGPEGPSGPCPGSIRSLKTPCSVQGSLKRDLPTWPVLVPFRVPNSTVWAKPTSRLLPARGSKGNSSPTESQRGPWPCLPPGPCR